MSDKQLAQEEIDAIIIRGSAAAYWLAVVDGDNEAAEKEILLLGSYGIDILEWKPEEIYHLLIRKGSVND